MKRCILVFAVLVTFAASLPALDLAWGLRAGAGGSLLYGGLAGDLRAELEYLGASTVTTRLYPSWRIGGWVEIPLLPWLSLRGEPSLGPVGGALLASDGYDLLVGVTAIELAVPVLAVTYVRLPFGGLVFGVGPYLAGALSVREVRNDGTIRSEGELSSVLGDLGLAGGVGYVLPVGDGAVTIDLRMLGSLFSLSSPALDAPLHTLSIELTAGWAFPGFGIGGSR